jgi:hypothetical protein
MVFTLPIFGVERLRIWHLDDGPIESCMVLMVSHVTFNHGGTIVFPFGRVEVLKVTLVVEFIEALLF